MTPRQRVNETAIVTTILAISLAVVILAGIGAHVAIESPTALMTVLILVAIAVVAFIIFMVSVERPVRSTYRCIEAGDMYCSHDGPCISIRRDPSNPRR